MGKMSLSIYMKGDYEELHALRRRENKANLFRIAYCVMRIAKRKLKKQSQFVSA
jgi:hypothetical protein